MGNQLSGIAPSQILSVESYFSDLPDYEFDCRWDWLILERKKSSQDLPMQSTFDYVFDLDLWLLTQARSLSAVNFLYFIVL